MANDKNLEKGKATQFNGETAAIAGRKGAVKSNQVQAEKKSLRETMNLLLELQVTPGNQALLQTMGIDATDQSNRMLLTVGLMKKAIQGDVYAFNSIRDLIGEKPIDKVATISTNTESIERFDKFFDKLGGDKNGKARK